MATKIEWCDMTWNPITGCHHDCDYCYAKGIVRRFEGYYDPASGKNLKALTKPHTVEHGGNIQYMTKKGKLILAPYPYGFAPTLHRHRLDVPRKVKKPQNIFVGSMADMFGEWVPDEWIKAVFEACAENPQHRYLFLTKNPNGLPLSSHIYDFVFGNHHEHMWFGMSITTQKDLENKLKGNHFISIPGNTFLSIEPLFGPINLKCADLGDVIVNLAYGQASTLLDVHPIKRVKWVIVGAESGNRKGKVIPQRKWIEDIVNACRAAGVPVFLKDNLAKIWDGPLVQEFPWEG